jgi:hypothetical protein
MAESDEINKVKKQLEDLKKSLDDISKKNIDRIIKAFTDGKASLAEWNQQLDLFQTQADLVSDSLDFVSKSLSDSVNQLKRGDELLRKQVNSTRKLSSIADQLLAVRKGESTYDKKKIDRLKEETKLRIQILNSINQQNPSQALQEDIKAATELLDAFDSIDKTASDINKQLGILPQSAKGIDKAFSKLGLGNLGIADAIDETHRLGQEAARVGNKDFKAMSTFTGQLKSKLKESITLTNAIQLSFSLLVDALKSVDDGAGQLAKSMNMTYSEALGTQQELTAMAASSFDVALNTKNLSETLMFVGKQLGSNAKLNEADLKIYTKLREQAGFTNEELYGIQQLSLVNNKSLAKNTEEILGGAKAYASRNKLVVNEKDILREVSKASATIKLSLGGSAEAVAEAAVQAKQFGLNLEQADKIAQSLLQFESSIENELSAELLLGKDLNFEKARQLSLNNDIAGAAEEIAKQVGTSADFAKMNAIQQEAIARAAGLTKDELAQSLMDKEALAKLSAKEGESSQEAFNRLVKEVGMEEAKKRLGEEGLANQFEQQSIQERLTQSVDKLKEIFVSLAEPVLAIVSPIVDLLIPALSTISFLLTPVFDMFNGIGKILTGSWETLNGWEATMGSIAIVATSIFTLTKLTAMYEGFIKGYKITQIALERANKTGILSTIGALTIQLGVQLGLLSASLATNAALTFGVGVAVAVAAAAAGYAAIKALTADDMMSPGESSSGYGKRTLFGPEGAIQLNDKDTVIAGTNLFDKETNSTSNSPQVMSVSNSTAPRRETPINPNAGMEMKMDNMIKAINTYNSISHLRIQ